MNAWQPWDTAPKDGTAFCIGTTVRFNPFSQQWEALYRGADRNEWHATDFGVPTAWIERPENAPPAPAWFSLAYTVTFERARGLFDRLIDCLAPRWLLAVYRGVSVHDLPTPDRPESAAA